MESAKDGLDHLIVFACPCRWEVGSDLSPSCSLLATCEPLQLVIFLRGLGWGQWLQHGLVVGKMTRTSVVAYEFWWWMKGLLLNPMLSSPGGSVCSMLSLLALSWRVLVGEGLGVLVLAE